MSNELWLWGGRMEGEMDKEAALSRNSSEIIQNLFCFFPFTLKFHIR